MPTHLEQKFHRAMVDIYNRARNEANYLATRYIQMVAEHGGLAAAIILINADKPSDGYTALWERGRLDITVEALVQDPSGHHCSLLKRLKKLVNGSENIITIYKKTQNPSLKPARNTAGLILQKVCSRAA